MNCRVATYGFAIDLIVSHRIHYIKLYPIVSSFIELYLFISNSIYTNDLSNDISSYLNISKHI